MEKGKGKGEKEADPIRDITTPASVASMNCFKECHEKLKTLIALAEAPERDNEAVTKAKEACLQSIRDWEISDRLEECFEATRAQVPHFPEGMTKEDYEHFRDMGKWARVEIARKEMAEKEMAKNAEK
ncbi:hypothetical protein FGRMN_7250 [Fusarium graminum]|nr:hypothetical protein FGRMN_7250 [Fusarium graminum]